MNVIAIWSKQTGRNSTLITLLPQALWAEVLLDGVLLKSIPTAMSFIVARTQQSEKQGNK